MNKIKEKNDLIFILMFLLIVVLAFLFLIQTSLGKYKRKAGAIVQNSIASWNIKVNNETINHKLLLTNTITPVILDSQFVKNGTIAPGTTGYFDIVINALDVDVDFTFELEASPDEETPLVDLKFTKYVIDNVEYNYDSLTPVSGNITKNTGDTSVRLYFEWYDGNDNEMDNADDTEYAIDPDHQNTNILVSITFKQRNT
ncbi:MAG: hypothetical protein IJG68_00450 [Bacilli bacterium]|nr:hypothetical protein [Bacilli bacterium]